MTKKTKKEPTELEDINTQEAATNDQSETQETEVNEKR